MNEKELFQTIHIDLVHKATDPVRDQDKLVDLAKFIYQSEAYELFKENEIGFTVEYKEVPFIEKDGSLNTEALKQIVVVYLYHLLWKIPNNKIIPFLTLVGVPKEKYELTAWFILYTFVHVNSTLGEMFRGTAVLDKEYIKFLLTNAGSYSMTPEMMDFFLSSKYYFSDFEINFK